MLLRARAGQIVDPHCSFLTFSLVYNTLPPTLPTLVSFHQHLDTYLPTSKALTSLREHGFAQPQAVAARAEGTPATTACSRNRQMGILQRHAVQRHPSL